MSDQTEDQNINQPELNIDVDKNRRLALKMIGGTAVLAATTGYSGALAAQAKLDFEQNPVELESQQQGVTHTGAELTITLSVDPVPTLRITNHSRKLIIVRHVHPGIIHAGARTFDINSLFERSAYAIGAGKSRNMAIEDTYATQAERDFPRHLFANKPQRIAAVTGYNYSGLLANSTRSYFA